MPRAAKVTPAGAKAAAPTPAPRPPKEKRTGASFARDTATKDLRTNKTGRGDGATTLKRRADGSPGNSKTDQAWIEAASARGELRIIEDDADVPFGIKTQYTGNLEDWGSAFQIPNPESRCEGRAYVRDEDGGRIIDADGRILTRPCARWRMRGSNVCGHHGGLTDGGKAIAQRRLTEAADMASGRLIRMIEDKNVDPAERLRAINSLLDRVGIKGGVEVTIETPAWQEMLKDMWEDEAKTRRAPEAAPRRRARPASANSTPASS